MISENRWMLLLAVVAAPAWAAQPMGCLIEPERVAEVGSQVVGVIESMDVERGDLVKKGQVLATLRADVERASVVVASSRAEAQADLQAAAANVTFNQQRLTRAEELFGKKFISQQALDQARTEAELAEQKLVQAKEQRRVLNRERELASAQLSQRVIRSPIDGVVAERYLSPGERVEDKPLVRVAKVDPLRVQVVVPTAFFGKIQPGSTATIMPELPDTRPVIARVTLVDKVIDAASNTFRVQLELPNADLALPAGLRCKADFGPELSAVRSTAQASPPPAAQLQPAALKTENKLAGGKSAAVPAAKQAY
jgi:cobalt-zinc-cadmium efflux system membrane fusion protein